jgi:hypothetical protein
MAWGKANDPDIWWHLRNAEYLFESHHLPDHDMYSFTVEGHDWVNHEWLSEIPYYLAWRGNGIAGMNLLSIVLLESIFLGLLYLCYQATGNIKASCLACSYCVFLAVVNFGLRTILFGYLFLVILLIILERFRSRRKGPLWLVPLLFCVWINAHGSWLLGLIIFFLIVAAGMLEGNWGRIQSVAWTASELRKLIITALATVACLFINPYGWRLVSYPFEFASKQKLNVERIIEWSSVDFHDGHGKLVMALLVGLVLAILFSDRRWRLADVALLLFGLYNGLTYVRFLFLLAVLVAPWLARVLDFVPPYEPEIDKPVMNVLFMGLAIIGILNFFPPPTLAQLENDTAKDFPVQALPYLRTHPPAGRVLNSYDWGGYLEWHDRDLKVFIDSRVDIFEYAGVLADYLDLMELKSPEKILDKYHVQYVLFSPRHRLSYALEHNPDWRVDYRDPVAILFERKELQIPDISRR